MPTVVVHYHDNQFAPLFTGFQLDSIDAALNLVLMFLHADAHGQALGLIPFLQGLNAGTDQGRVQNLPVVRLKFNDLVDTRITVMRDFIAQHRGELDGVYRNIIDADLLQVMNAVGDVGAQLTTAENAANAVQRQAAFRTLLERVIRVSHLIERSLLRLKEQYIRQCRRTA